MRFQEIREIAKDMGVGTYRMKKTDLVRTIQREENNIEVLTCPHIMYHFLS